MISRPFAPVISLTLDNIIDLISTIETFDEAPISLRNALCNAAAALKDEDGYRDCIIILRISAR